MTVHFKPAARATLQIVVMSPCQNPTRDRLAVILFYLFRILQPFRRMDRLVLARGVGAVRSLRGTHPLWPAQGPRPPHAGLQRYTLDGASLLRPVRRRGRRLCVSYGSAVCDVMLLCSW